MRLSSIAMIVLLPLGAIGAQQTVNIGRAAAPDVSVRLSGAFSSLRVIAWANDSLSLTGSVGAGSRLEGGGFSSPGPAKGMKFFIEMANDANIAANKLELRVPRGARVWVKAGSADIDVIGVGGGLDLNIIGGSITVNGKPRELIAESMDGSVRFTGFADFARLKTATGDIMLEGGGEDLLLSTVSGTITAANGERPLHRARFESVTGSITYTGEPARGGDFRFDTHSGSVELRLPRPANLEVDAATVTGRIENAWSSARGIAGREGRGMELGFSSGMGGARVSIRSFKGNVRLAPR